MRRDDKQKEEQKIDKSSTWKSCKEILKRREVSNDTIKILKDSFNLELERSYRNGYEDGLKKK
ncbi:MAG: hypothetical protein KAU20_05725 [Nanoarchaeota archaeon]|nr:hypothetical protein [Nanoarchaeota archaeon]